MTRLEVVLAGSLLVVLLAVIVGWYAMPNVVSCVDNSMFGEGDTPPGHTPAMSLQVTTDRRGHIEERPALGCTFYSYVPSQD